MMNLDEEKRNKLRETFEKEKEMVNNYVEWLENQIFEWWYRYNALVEKLHEEN